MSDVTAFPSTSALVPLSRLPREFRENAATARRLAGAESAALVWEAAAAEVEGRLSECRQEPLTLDAAALESGYSRSNLLRMLREGTVPNAGSKKEPRILRMHLPRKPGFGIDERPLRPASSRVQAARAVIEGEN